jgi:ribosomal-protein-alanine N-acetyltransferase
VLLPVVGPLTVDDLDEIMVLERQCFQDPWSRRMYLTDLTQNSLATYLTLRAGGPGIVAYGGFWLLMDEAHIATIASHPGWRGCGLGQWLLVALLDAAIARTAVRATLEVRAGNRVAQRLYEKLGFEVMGVRKHYYRDGEDGLIMTTGSFGSPEMQARIEAARTDALARATRCFQPLSEAPAV